MRRRRRWAFNFATAVSAVLFLAVCVLWVRTRSGVHAVSIQQHGRQWAVVSYHGLLTFAMSRIYWAPLRADSLHEPQEIGFDNTGLVRGYHNCYWIDPRWIGGAAGPLPNSGVAFRHWRRGGGVCDLGMIDLYDCHTAQFPHWMLALVLAVMPVLRGRSATRQIAVRRRLRCGKCASCGYDLRATPEA
jgi:hypothetical protein